MSVTHRWIAILVGLTLLLSGCGSARTAPTQPPPTLTLTPFSTPLPTVATSEPFGTERRPYRIVIVPPENSDSTTTRFRTYLNTQTGRVFEVVVLSPAEALAALCSGTPVIGIVDGWTMVSAAAQGCASPTLAIERGSGARRGRGYRADIIASSELRIANLTGLGGRSFCRVEAAEIVGWVLPAMLIRTFQIDPVTILKEVRLVANNDVLVKEVANAQCVGAIPAGTLAGFIVPGIQRITAAVSVIATTPELPYGGVVVTTATPKAIADQVTRLLKDLPTSLEGLIDAEAFVDTSASDIAAMVTLLREAGITTP